MAKNERESFFRKAAYLAPIGIGAGIGVYKFIKQPPPFFDRPISQVLRSQETINQFVSQYNPAIGEGLYRQWQLDKMVAFTKGNLNLSSQQIIDTWMRAAKISDPSGGAVAALGDRLVGQTPQEILQSIQNSIQSSTSPYVKRAASIFIEDITNLQRLAETGQTIDVQPFRVSIPKIRSSLLGPKDLSKRTWEDITKIQNQLQANISLRRVSRSDFPGSELHLSLSGESIKGRYRIRIPGVFPGKYETVATRGITQQSRYIAGKYGIIEKGILTETFNHEEYTIRRILEELVPEIQKQQRLDRRTVNSLIRGFNTRMTESFQLVKSTPAGIHEGWDEWTKIRSQILHLRDPSGKPLDLLQYADLIEQGNIPIQGGGTLPIMPGYSPGQIGKSIASTLDYTGFASLIGASEEIARRPMQWFRAEYAPTAQALEFMKSEDPLSKRFAWAGTERGIATPIAETAYISSKYAPQLQSMGVTTEGMGLLSNRLRVAREVEKLSVFEISTRSVSAQAKALLKKNRRGRWNLGGQQLKAETFLGYDVEGRPIIVPQGASLVEATAFEDVKKQEFIRFLAKQKVPMGDLSKVYLGGKMMAWEETPEYLSDILSSIGVRNTFGNVDAIVSMDELRKTRRNFYNQLFTSLWHYTDLNNQSGKHISSLASNFANNPRKVLATIAESSKSGQHLMNEEVVKWAWQLARAGKLTPEQIGYTFGAIPEVFKDTWKNMLTGITPQEEKLIGRGVAKSFSQFFFGGPIHGAGKRATLEPRGYSLLTSPHLGNLGVEIQQDILNRMMAANPALIEEQKVLSGLLQNISQRGAIPGATTATDLLQSIGEAGLPSQETALSLSGIGDIRIPAQGSIPSLTPIVSPTGAPIFSPLQKSYMETIGLAASYERGEISQKQMMKAVNKLGGLIAHQQALTISGKGGLLRGRLLGSRFLTATTPRGGYTSLDPFTIGISEEMGGKMFGDLEKLYDKAAIQRMRERFITGEAVSGVSFRHPLIGPYSVQPVRFQKVAGKGAFAVVNEMLRKVSATNLGKEAMDLGMLRFSPLVGMSGDTDGDFIAAMMASPQLEKSLTTHLNSQTVLDLHEEYIIRKQIMKAKGASKTLATAIQAERAGGTIGLGVPQTQLGRVSLALEEARGSILSRGAGLSPQETTDALALLDWMEQTPISGKHIPPERAKEMMDMFTQIENSIKQRNANDLANTARQTLATADLAAQKALREGLDITMEDIATGAITQRHIRGLNIQNTSENIINAIRSADVSATGTANINKIRRFEAGRYIPKTIEEAMGLLSPTARSESILGEILPSTTIPGMKGMMARVSAEVSAKINRFAAMGGKLLPYAKPLAIGTAASVGLAMLLSKPTPMVDPPRVSPSLESGTGGAYMTPDSMVPGELQGSPTAVSLMSSRNTARITDNRKRISIRGTSSGPIDYQSFNNQINQIVGGQARVSSSINDRRSSLTQQRISDILNDE